MDTQSQGGEELHHEPEKPKSEFAKREEKVLAFWNNHHIFEKSLQKPAPKGEYIFYDGPPFANGLPHYGHILASSIKDAIPRYRTMQGFRVPRQWGWDCHGLPVENLVEKQLGFKNKRDIEEFGIAKFNETARKSIMQDVSDWRRIIPRMGRWADMENDYKTMDATYTESVWWAFKRLHSKKLIYEGFKAMHLCPRCSTTLSNFEVAQGYADIEDFAVTVKLPLVDEPETSLLIWTTTPWTLPGNTAAAVNAEAVYVKAKVGDGFVVVAKALAEKVLGADVKVHGEILGKDLVGKRYTPPFDYFVGDLHKHKTHAWRVYAAPYVTLEDGTGIVHLAPAYGAEDLELAQKEKIPLIHHVTDEGKFVATVTDFAHLPVKPKGRHMETDAKIIENLKERGLLFHSEKVTHSYPHCWRCDTPLLNWAANSWFVNVQSIKPKLLAQNKRVTWVPGHVGVGRFQNGLASAPDWAISRSRYWGAPIPVWRHSKTKELKVVGSVKELLSLVRRSGNTYVVMRHGEAKSNVEGFVNSTNEIENNLTEVGKEQVRTSAQTLKKMGIDMVVVSPLVRTQETAQIVCRELGLQNSVVMTDTRLVETQFGEHEGKRIEEWRGLFATLSDKFNHALVGAENYNAVRTRVGDFLFDIEQRYSGKTILIVTHEVPAWLLTEIAAISDHKDMESRTHRGHLFTLAEHKKIDFIAYPHSATFALDLHRPYIDEVPLGDAVHGEWKRVTDVFDCWFESGSMPFARGHYPFNKKGFHPTRMLGLFSKGYPADFIAEGLDQTRGWFYSLIVLGTALFGKSPYKNVIVNGMVLAQDGQKMSKRLKNYPDPMDVVASCGADALRYTLLSSSVVHAEDFNFSMRSVEEVAKKLLMRLDNVRSFYELYVPTSLEVSSRMGEPKDVRENSLARSSSKDGRGRPEDFFAGRVSADLYVLDRWILSRLGELVRDTTSGFEKYELDVAMRPLASFIDDLSTWYVRRSRDRFKVDGDDKQQALATLRHVLYTTALVMAPAMPFFAEDLFQKVKSEDETEAESVHLAHWPVAGVVDEQLLKDMNQVRELSSLGLQEREKAGIKVRQPLAKLSVKTLTLSPELCAIIAEEINVKEIVEDKNLNSEVGLDTELTPELEEEGIVRDLTRRIQGWRKTQGLVISDRPVYELVVSEKEATVAHKHKAALVVATGLSELTIVEENA
ncbi:MAG: class I tRNA ligase family protein [bacterium]